MRRVLITGVAGYIGGKLAAYLAEKPEVGQIVGTDIRRPMGKLPKLTFYERDVRSPLHEILTEHSIDTVVHAAYVLPPLHNEGLMEDINLNGTRSVLSSCAEAGVSHILYLSSATAYDFHPDNDRPLTEGSPLRGNEDLIYSKTKRIIEGIFEEFVSHHPDILVTILRPSWVVGPGFDNPFSRYLQRRLVMIPRNGEPFQFVHEDDLIEVIYRLISERRGGVYNVGTEGAIAPEEMVRMMGNIPICIPYGLLYVLNGVAWFLRLTFLTEFPSPALQMIRYPWIVSSEKLKREIGYSYKFTSREAFQDFVSHLQTKKS